MIPVAWRASCREKYSCAFVAAGSEMSHGDSRFDVGMCRITTLSTSDIARDAIGASGAAWLLQAM